MSVVTLVLSIAIPLTWLAGRSINVYRFKVIGAVYELVWLPMFVILFALPVTSFIFWVKNKFSLRSLYFYSFLISALSILLITTSK